MMFKKHNINLNSSNNTLKRVLAPHQHNLSRIVMCLYGFITNIVTISFASLSRDRSLRNGIFDFCDKYDREALGVISNSVKNREVDEKSTGVISVKADEKSNGEINREGDEKSNGEMNNPANMSA